MRNKSKFLGEELDYYQFDRDIAQLNAEKEWFENKEMQEMFLQPAKIIILTPLDYKQHDFRSVSSRIHRDY